MTRTATIYKIAGQKFAFPTMAAAERHRDDWTMRCKGAEITAAEIELPDDVFWQGDTISVELHRGGSDDMEGIHHGGGWIKSVGYVQVRLVGLSQDGQVVEVEGVLRELGTDRHIQSMTMRAGKIGFPYRNAQLVNRQEPLQSGAF